MTRRARRSLKELEINGRRYRVIFFLGKQTGFGRVPHVRCQSSAVVRSEDGTDHLAVRFVGFPWRLWAAADHRPVRKR